MTVEVEKRLLDIDDICKYLNIKRKTVYNMVSGGNFPVPPKRIGRRLLWDRKKVDAWIEGK